MRSSKFAQTISSRRAKSVAICESLAGLDRVIAQISRDKRKLDVVFANAGIAELAPIRENYGRAI